MMRLLFEFYLSADIDNITCQLPWMFRLSPDHVLRRIAQALLFAFPVCSGFPRSSRPQPGSIAMLYAS